MLQVLLQVDVLLGSNQHEGLLITQVFLCLVSNVIRQFKNNFSDEKVLFWISDFGYRAIVLHKQHIVQCNVHVQYY